MESTFKEWKEKYGLYLAIGVIVILLGVILFSKTPSYKGKSGDYSNYTSTGTGADKGAPDYATDEQGTGVKTNTFLLTTYTVGNGAGTITGQGINCGASGVDCDEKVEESKLYTLYATPSTGSIFAGWLGSCTGTGDCRLFIDSAKQVTAIFNLKTTNISAPAGTITYSLIVSKAGTGSGSVLSEPAGINCGGTCSYSYANNSLVVLSPTAAAGSTFSSWSGCDAVSGTLCQVLITRAKTVTATFVLSGGAANYTLTASVSGNKSGSLISSPVGINCPPTCTATYTSGTAVTLTPVAGEVGAFLYGWGGACSGVAVAQCTVTMDASKSASVTFTSSPGDALTVYKTGAGSGTVTSNPARINCSPTCVSYFNFGTSVTLTATPAAGSSFTGWSGACTGASPTCTVVMNWEKTVTANFAVTPIYVLSIDKGGNGSGTVNSDDGAIKCGSYCSYEYPGGTVLWLTAEPFVGSEFSGWSGGGCSGVSDCQVTMDSSKSVDATFTRLTYGLTAEKFGSGDGKVTSSPYGIQCETGCVTQTTGFAFGTVVTLTINPNAGSSFAGWGGACAGVGAIPTCNVNVTSAKYVSVTFNSP